MRSRMAGRRRRLLVRPVSSLEGISGSTASNWLDVDVVGGSSCVPHLPGCADGGYLGWSHHV
jgi:hypothetical protein